MKSAKLAALAAVFATNAYASDITNQFDLHYGEPDGRSCASSADIGRTAFDPDSGRLWACGSDGWVYFESKASDRLSCLNNTENLAKYPEWKPRPWNVRGGSYHKGEIVRYKGKLYTPSNATVHAGKKSYPEGSWDWQPIQSENSLPVRWEASHQYSRGDRVVLMGIEYQAHEANAAKAPNDGQRNYQPWDYIGPFSCPKS